MTKHINTDKAFHRIVDVLSNEEPVIKAENLELRLKEIAKDAQRNCCWELLERFNDTPMQEVAIINEYLEEL